MPSLRVIPHGFLGTFAADYDGGRFREATLCFAYSRSGSSNDFGHDTRVYANHEFGGAYCEVCNVWTPGSRLRKDGKGRAVCDRHVTTAPEVWWA